MACAEGIRKAKILPSMATSHHGELLTRTSVARLLGISERRVRQLRDQGKLHPTTNREGVHFYERSEIMKLAAARANSSDPRLRKKGVPVILAARVFEMFDNGATLSQIVQDTQQTPDVVRALYVEYSTPLGKAPATAPDPNAELARHDRLMGTFAQAQARRFDRAAPPETDDER